MLFLLSPAKSLDFEAPAHDAPHTQPLFVKQAEPLIKALRKKSWRQVSKLMDLSQALSELNVARYQAWSPEFTPQNAKQSVLAFNGDVYDGLNAKTLSADDLAWAQAHLCILSGLYGVLRPLDLMQPYRLEMGTALKVGRPDNLYQYWRKTIAPYLNERLNDTIQGDAQPVVVNLASQEYFKSVNLKLLKARVVECVFEDFSGGSYKVVSFFAKKARGMMARHAITQQIQAPEKLQSFFQEGYGFCADASTPDRLVFRRKMPAAT
jgi:uncharacterized protein